MLPLEHSAILLTCIMRYFVSKKTISSFFESGRFIQVLLYCISEYTENLVEEGVSMDEPSAEKREERLRKPLIDRCRPIAQQCRELLLEEVGDILVRGIFNRSKVMKKQCVLLLHDLVQHGEVNG